MTPPDGWIEKRADIYKINAEKLEVEPPKVEFYVYPSLEEGKKIGITPAITFIKEKIIHGHIKQSPGHELTHILLGELNPSEDLPANGLWAEGVCVYLDGTGTDRKKHTNSIGYGDDIINTPWPQWTKNLPGDLYPLAGSIIQYSVEKFGWLAVLQFLKEMENSEANEEKLSIKIFQMSYAKLQEGWQKWLKV